jgi:uncharacterized alkaline shock family protein YloU
LNLLERFILTLYSLTLIVLSGIVMAASLNFIPYTLVQANLEAFYQAGSLRYAYLIGAFILFLISLNFLFHGFKRKTDRSTKTAVSQRTDVGDVSITMNTLESIALKASRKIRGVKEVKANIRTNETGTSILLKVSVDGDTPIPSIVEELQNAVKKQLELIIGIEIKEVNVKVTEVSHQQTARLSRVE